MAENNINELATATQVAKQTAAKIKEEVKSLKAALNATETEEEKMQAKQVLQEAESRAADATQKVAVAVAAEAAARDAVQEQKTAKEAEQVKNDPFVKLAERYSKSYPDCPEFHITTDKQVFLQADRDLAVLHQRSLKEGEVRTVKIR